MARSLKLSPIRKAASQKWISCIATPPFEPPALICDSFLRNACELFSRCFTWQDSYYISYFSYDKVLTINMHGPAPTSPKIRTIITPGRRFIDQLTCYGTFELILLFFQWTYFDPIEILSCPQTLMVKWSSLKSHYHYLMEYFTSQIICLCMNC